jgi:hypothetical protein
MDQPSSTFVAQMNFYVAMHLSIKDSIYPLLLKGYLDLEEKHRNFLNFSRSQVEL